MTPDLVLRVVLSLVCVLGLVWLGSRGLRRSPVGRAAAAAAGVAVLSRQVVGQRACVAVVRVGERALVLGVTEHQVSLLTEATLEQISRPEASARVLEEDLTAELAGPVGEHPVRRVPRQQALAPALASQSPSQSPSGPLAGSALSPHTWARAVEAVRDRTARR